MADFTSFIIGQPTIDVNTDFGGTPKRAYGGAVLYSGFAAARTGHTVAALAKVNPATLDLADAFRGSGVTLYPVDSPQSICIENVYHTADRERRTSRVLSMIEPYRADELPKVDAAVWQLAGLVAGDLSEDFIGVCAKRAPLALDVQCMLRCVEDGAMVFHDWARKKDFLPLLRFLKTDAAEAEILTGSTDRAYAIRKLYDWGAQEILITHNSEVMVYDGRQLLTAPIRSRSLTGRTGRGDTTFAGYINERQTKSMEEALLFATALVSLKMETLGPFMGTRRDVEEYLNTFYTPDDVQRL